MLRQSVRLSVALVVAMPLLAATPAVSPGISYKARVLPACKEAVTDRYPFFGASATDADQTAIQRVFGKGGTIDAFVAGPLGGLIDRSGPAWRWKPGPRTARLDPATPDEFAKAAQIRDVLAGGLTIDVGATGQLGDVDAVEITFGDAKYIIGTRDPQVHSLVWSAGATIARVRLMQHGIAIATFEDRGPWALFRLIDRAKRENEGPERFRATFADGGNAATVRVKLPSEKNPFSRGGMWSFRCPAAL